MKRVLLYQIALTKIPFVGAKIAKHLIAYCGGVQAVFETKKSHLLKIPGLGDGIASKIAAADPKNLAIQDLDYLERNDIKTTFYLDQDYPPRLKHFEDSPLLLYYKGSPNWNAGRTVGIVGTRKPSPYGRSICQKLIHDLIPYKVQIISGLAYGVDALTHHTANQHGVENLAIMGTGIDQIYPSQNRSIAMQTMKNGALITEYPIGTKPDRENFPRRNRIIAGLSDAIVVIQSAEKGGSLITAEYANDYFKDVFAFPGRISDEYSSGCNRLIKINKAHLMESAQDIAYIMRWELDDHSKTAKQTELFLDLSDIEKKVLKAISKDEDVSIDSLHSTLKLPLSDLSSTLLHLEFKGLVNSLPGKRYVVCRSVNSVQL